MLRQIAVASVVAVGGVYAYKHRFAINKFVASGGGFSGRPTISTSAVSNQVLEAEIAQYRRTLSNPGFALSPYQICLKNGLLGTASDISLDASRKVVEDCKLKHKVA